MPETWQEHLARLLDQLYVFVSGGRHLPTPEDILDLLRRLWNFAAGVPLERETTLADALIDLFKPLIDFIINTVNTILKGLYGLIRPNIVAVATVVGTAIGYYGILTRHEVPLMRRIIGIFVDPIISWMMGVVLDKLLPPDIPAPIPPSPPPPPPASLEYKAEVPASSEALGSYQLFTAAGGPTETPASGSVDAQYIVLTGLQLPAETPAQGGVGAAYQVYLKTLLYSPEAPAQGGVEAAYELAGPPTLSCEAGAVAEVAAAWEIPPPPSVLVQGANPCILGGLGLFMAYVAAPPPYEVAYPPPPPNTAVAAAVDDVELGETILAGVIAHYAG